MRPGAKSEIIPGEPGLVFYSCGTGPGLHPLGQPLRRLDLQRRHGRLVGFGFQGRQRDQNPGGLLGTGLADV